MFKENKVERLTYSGGLLGVLFGSSKGKLQTKVKEMNQLGWNLHLIHRDEVNLVIILLRWLMLLLTLGLWTIGSSVLLIFEKAVES